MHRKKHDDLDEYDELLKQAMLEHRRKVFLKKLLLTIALVTAIGGIVYREVNRDNLQAQAVVEQQKQ